MWNDAHALIISDDATIASAIEQRLTDAGFATFDHAETELKAVGCARRHLPDLVVLSDRLDDGSPISAARQIFELCDVPMLLVAPKSSRGALPTPRDAEIIGPFPFFDASSPAAHGSERPAFIRRHAPAAKTPG